MNVSDEQVLAYVDGELDAAAAEALRREIATNAELRQRVAAQQALRERVRRVFDRTLEEPVPAQLAEAAARRGARRSARPARRSHPLRTAWLGGLAAAAGIVLGVALAPSLTQLVGRQPDVVARDGGLVAGGRLANVLSNQLASEQPAAAPVRLGVSFLDKSGAYCRTFVAAGDGGALAGLACRHGGAWDLRTLEAERGSGESGGYRQAASPMSPAILQAVEATMAGDALDARAERAARDRGWRVLRR